MSESYRMNGSRLMSVGLALLFGSLAAAGDYRLEIPAQPGERLKIDLETGAGVEIVGWAQNQVQIHAEFRGRHAKDISFNAWRQGDTVFIRSEYETRRHNQSSSGDVQIKIPYRFDVILESNGGEVDIREVEGTIEGQTMGGELSLRELRGDLDLTTMGGEIELVDSEVDGKVSTMGGDVLLRNVTGNVEATTMGGDVEYDNVRTTGGCEEVRISSMGGNIDAPNAPCGADLSTMGGNIEIDSAERYVNAETMGGNIKIGAVDGWVRATTYSGNIEVIVVGNPSSGERDIRLDSKSGDIALTVPDGMSMEIDVRLAYTKRSKQNYRIISDFPLETRDSGQWEYSEGSPRKYITGKARVDGGTHRVRIETINGNVRIRRGS